MSILRAMGARPQHVFALLVSEASVLTLVGILLGVSVLYLLLALAAPLITSQYGIQIALAGLTAYEWQLLGCVQLAGIVIGLFPHCALIDNRSVMAGPFAYRNKIGD